MVIFSFSSLAGNDFNMKLISMISYILCSGVYPIVVVGLYFKSKISKISLYVSWHLYTISSRSLHFDFFLVLQVFDF